MLQQHVLASDAQIGRAELYVGWRVGSPHEYQAEIGPVGTDNEFSGNFRILQEPNPGPLEQWERLIKDPALGQGDGDHQIQSEKLQIGILPQPFTARGVLEHRAEIAFPLSARIPDPNDIFDQPLSRLPQSTRR